MVRVLKLHAVESCKRQQKQSGFVPNKE